MVSRCYVEAEKGKFGRTVLQCQCRRLGIDGSYETLNDCIWRVAQCHNHRNADEASSHDVEHENQGKGYTAKGISREEEWWVNTDFALRRLLNPSPHISCAKQARNLSHVHRRLRVCSPREMLPSIFPFEIIINFNSAFREHSSRVFSFRVYLIVGFMCVVACASLTVTIALFDTRSMLDFRTSMARCGALTIRYVTKKCKRDSARRSEKLDSLLL